MGQLDDSQRWRTQEHKNRWRSRTNSRRFSLYREFQSPIKVNHHQFGTKNIRTCAPLDCLVETESLLLFCTGGGAGCCRSRSIEWPCQSVSQSESLSIHSQLWSPICIADQLQATPLPAAIGTINASLLDRIQRQRFIIDHEIEIRKLWIC